MKISFNKAGSIIYILSLIAGLVFASFYGGSSADPEGMSKMTEDFLFDTGAGYCVHHAVAMVMLLRLNGIPARLNIGYRYVFPYEKQDSYELKGSSGRRRGRL